MGLTAAALKAFPIVFVIGIENSLLDNYEIWISFLLWEANVLKELYYNAFS